MASINELLEKKVLVIAGDESPKMAELLTQIGLSTIFEFELPPSLHRFTEENLVDIVILHNITLQHTGQVIMTARNRRDTKIIVLATRGTKTPELNSLYAVFEQLGILVRPGWWSQESLIRSIEKLYRD